MSSMYREARMKALSQEASADSRTAATAHEAGTPSESETLVAYVNAPGRSAVGVELVAFSEDNPSWVVFQNGDPVARIALSNIPDAADIADVFVSSDWANGFKKTAAGVGLDNALRSVHAEIYAASISRTAAFEDLRTAARQSVSEELKATRTATKQNLMEHVDLAVEATLNNFIAGGDPLRHALYSEINRVANVDSDTLVGAIESAFRQSGVEYFKTIMDRAESYADMPSEALAVISDSVKEYGYRSPRPATTKDTPLERAAKNSFPFSTADETEISPETKADIKRRLFRS